MPPVYSPEPDDAPPRPPAPRAWWQRLLERIPPAGMRLRPAVWWRMLRGSGLRRSARADGGYQMLPVLIEVFAGFSKLGGAGDEVEIDSSLGYLRYDYPEAIYADLRRRYFEALQKPQDLNERARELSRSLTMEQKILLGVQL